MEQKQTKILNPIKKTDVGEVHVTVVWDGARLSITGVEGPRSDGNALGACGQIDTTLREDKRETWTYKPGWDEAMMTRLLEVWGRWHLNDLKAGTPKQEEFIREWNETNRYDYVEACNALGEAGLLVDYDYLPPDEDGENRGYRYGTAWLTEEVPAGVIEWLFALPPSTAPMPTAWLRN